MLKSNRFTTAVTQGTADRLARALENSPPIARRERNRGAVVAVQTALAALSSGYVAGAEIDGYFGDRTAAAVEAFQRDYGLIADGVVGAQVLAQLDQIFAGEDARPPHGVSLHIGVDKVDPTHYGGDLALPSCVNDANEMERVADKLGYDTAILTNEQATCPNVAGFLRNAAMNLFAGDALFFTYSGHGSQVPNDSDDDEPDLKDETLVLYDRMLIDDEIFALLGEFREGVRVHLVFDSCHSGTVFKQLASPDARDMIDASHAAFKEDALATMKSLGALHIPKSVAPEEAKPITVKSLDKALSGGAPETSEPKGASDEVMNETAELFADLAVKTLTGAPKFFTGDQVYANNKDVYTAVRAAVGARERDRLSCTVTAFSAAMDSQTTPSGQPLSLFTFNISQTWSGGFPGSYVDLHRAVLNRSRADATPQLTPDGSMGSKARLHERPFAF